MIRQKKLKLLKFFCAVWIGLGYLPTANAFWLLNFQTAPTLAPGAIGFIGGTGGQFTSVGSPASNSFTPFLAHAGIRVGLADSLDVGYSYLLISGQTKDAWSPGTDFILTHPISKEVDLSWNGRYVYSAIPSATGGEGGNHVQAIGGSMSAKFALTSNVALLPEVGVFNFTGSLAGNAVNGWGFQYGAVLSAKIN